MAKAVSTKSFDANSMYANPLGCPSSLLHRIVTRFMLPQPALTEIISKLWFILVKLGSYHENVLPVPLPSLHNQHFRHKWIDYQFPSSPQLTI